MAPATSGAPAQDNQLGSKFVPAANGQVNYKNLLAGGLARGVAFSVLALAVAPFIFTTPAHAADDNTVSIAVDQNASLQPSGTLYKATTNVKVTTGKPYGFNLTMQADTADLVNNKDKTHKISATPSSTPVALNANQWGYSLNKSATTFSAVPAGAQATPAVVADVTKAKPAGCTDLKNCTKSVTFAANIDPTKLASGSYSTTITYTATAKPKPEPTRWTVRTANTNPSELCQSGNADSSCLVDLDPNMIPVKYNDKTAEWESIANPEDDKHQGEWYDYKDNSKKDTKWANAVTVVNPQDYKGQAKPVKQSDILGFWVYIPRYRYKVLRFSGSDPAVSAQNFTIKFENRGENNGENKGSKKAIPTATGDWATHPAFTFGTKKLNGLDVPNELNGIWFAKFETTWNGSQPTVLPNEAHMSGNYTASSSVGRMYNTAKTLGVADRKNFGGYTYYSVPTQNNHHLAKLSSHMVNNNDWGAATYLSASKYGAGYKGVQINANGAKHTNYGDTYGTTGCGPQANGNTNRYNDSGTLDTPQACGNADRAYNGSIGKFASTTNNVYGIYDMSGGGQEYVAASHSDNLNNSNTNSCFGPNAAHPPYVNTYNITDLNNCTFNTCGGQALYETNNGTGDGYGYNQWNGQWLNIGSFASFSPWFYRGGYYDDGSSAGLFSARDGTGYGGDYDSAFRVALAPLQD